MQHSLKEMEQAALLMLHDGKNQEAFEVCCVALKAEGAPRIFNLIMAQVASKANIKTFNPIVKNALSTTINAYGIEAQLMALPWIKMLLYDSTFDPLHAFLGKDYVFNVLDWYAFEACMNEPFFISGLKNIVIQNADIEIALRNIRKSLLQNLLPENKLKTKHLEFICALAENCYGNEYVFYATEEELAKVASLSLNDPINIAVFACYESLLNKEVDHKCSAVAAFKHLIQVQIKEPSEEQILKSSIEKCGFIKNDVSLKVRKMYENNPYPRWRTLNVSAGTYTYVGDVLIAGCGTGRYLIQTALMFPNVQFQAVDITAASLAYSMRKTKSYGAKNIDFKQCDILQLDALDKKFDLINCSGVLHHMEDPLTGWKSLISRLNPGGVMSIGLYSTIARKVIFDARDKIVELKLNSHDDGIRAFRDYVFSLPDGNEFESLKNFRDFYMLSETRDLLFHVQEATYSIPELEEIFDTLDLQFMGFKIPDPETGRRYKEDYPDDPRMLNLKNWAEFEAKYPNTFAGMYNFLCKKKGDTFRNIKTEQLVDTGVFN